MKDFLDFMISIDVTTINGKLYRLYEFNEHDDVSVHFPWTIYFRQYILTENDVPKYLVGLYQDGEIWSSEEIYGTKIVDLGTVKPEENYHNSYVGSGVDVCWFLESDIKDIFHCFNTEDIDEIYI